MPNVPAIPNKPTNKRGKIKLIKRAQHAHKIRDFMCIWIANNLLAIK